MEIFLLLLSALLTHTNANSIYKLIKICVNVNVPICLFIFDVGLVRGFICQMEIDFQLTHGNRLHESDNPGLSIYIMGR